MKDLKLRNSTVPCSIFDIQVLDQMIDAPQGIKRLRELILQLAVQGKLGEQRPEEGTADELLKQIEEAKRKDAEERKARGERVRKAKSLPAIGKDEVPFKIPEGWELSRLQNILDVRDGTHDSPKDATGADTFPLVTSKNFINGGIDFDGARRISAKDHCEIIKRSKVNRYDILFSMIGGNIGNQVIVEVDREFSIKNVALFKYYDKELTNPYFIKRYMENLALNLQAEAAGGAQPFVSLGYLRNLVVAIPPVAEQKRIVAKVDELMAWCDELDSLKQKRDTLQKAALKSSLRDLHDLRGENSLARIVSNFSGLVRGPDDVKQLRDAILQLAAQGRLVPQRPEDGTADELLTKIEAAKATDLARRKANGERIRKTKPTPPIIPEEIPFEIPNDWKWVRLGNVQDFTNGYAFKSQDYQDSGVGIIRMRELGDDGSIDERNMRFVSEEVANSISDIFKVRNGDLLMGMSGSIGKLAINKSDTEYMLNQRVGRLEPIVIDKDYLYIFLKTAEKRYLEISFGMAIKNLSTRQINDTEFPLPPLAEQQRIVKKVDELMAWCDELETHLQTASDTATRFAAAIAQQGGK